MIEVEHLSKSYGRHVAVNDVSFQVQQGEVVGFVGPNGAGKSTTLRIISGFLGLSTGRVQVAGFDIVKEPMAARARLGYMPETSPLYPEMRVSEYLMFRAELKLVTRKMRRSAVERALQDARIDDVANVVISHLSKGYRQRVGLADALVSDPPLLVLDEPTAGLDPNQIREVRSLIQKLGHDRTILLSTHILSEVEATCTRALVIHRGKLVAQGSIDEIRALQRSPGVKVVLRATLSKALAATKGIAGVLSSKGEATGDTVTLAVDFDANADATAVTEELARTYISAGFGLREITPSVASLEQVFSQLTLGAESQTADASGEQDAQPDSSDRASKKRKKPEPMNKKGQE